MDNNEDKTKSGTLAREFSFALVTFAIMIGSIFAADRMQELNILTGDMAYILKEFATYLSRISLVLLTVWIYKGIGFPRTIGPDFKKRFTKGWSEMSDTEATKWMIIVFLGLFIGAALLMLA